MRDSNWARASLRVFSNALTPEELAEVLAIQPDKSYRIGDRISRRPSSMAVRETNALFVESGLPNDRDLDEHLTALLDRIEGASENLRSLAGRAKMDVFCGFSSGNGLGGFLLSPSLLTRLATLGLDVDFDLYLPPAELAPDVIRDE